MKEIYKKTTVGFFIALILILGFYLRMLPYYNTRGVVHFKYDNAFHVRMIFEVFEKNSIPQTDVLSLFPEGRHVSRELPTLVYYLGGYFSKALHILNKKITLLNSVLYFCAILGALIAIPTYLIYVILLKDKRYALLASLLSASFLPYLTRTFCYKIRYDALGSLFLFFSLYFFIRSLKESRISKNIIWSVVSGAVFILALATWRISLTFLLLYSFGAILLAGFKNINFVRSYIIFSSMALFSFLFIPYLASNKTILLSFGPWILYSFIFLRAIYLVRSKSARMYNFIFLIAVLVFCIYIARFYFGEILYTTFLKPTGFIARNVSMSGFDYLLYNIEELQGLSVVNFFGKAHFGLAGLFPFIFIGYLKAQKQFVNKSENKNIIYVLFVFFILAMFVITLLFMRFRILLAPLVAISIAGTLQCSLHNFYKIKTIIKSLNILVAAVAIIASGYALHGAYVVAKHLGSVFDTYTVESLKWIDKNVPKKSAILTNWADGYIVQLYATRPTVTDGLLEDRENRKRIIETAEALYSFDQKELYLLCKRLGARYILMPTDKNEEYAITASKIYSDYFDGQNSPTKMCSNTTLYKLFYAPENLADFTLKQQNKKYLIYEVGF